MAATLVDRRSNNFVSQGLRVYPTCLARRSPTPPGIFILYDGMGLVAKRLEHVPNNDPPKVRVISDNTFYSPYERTADEIHIIGRVRWFAREL